MANELETTYGAEPAEIQQDGPLTVETAYARLQELKDGERSEPEPREQPERPREPAHEAPADGGLWTNEDVQDLNTFQQEAQRLQQDMQTFAEVKAGVDLNALEGQDRGRAQALRVQMSEAEQELRARHERLSQVAQQIASTAESRQQERLERHLAAEQRKLAERVPDLDKSALVPYLRRVGFSDAEIAEAADARLIELAEKARRYDEMSTQSTTRKVPVKRKGASRQPPSKPKGEAARAEARFRKTRNIHDAAEMLAARRMEASNG